MSRPQHEIPDIEAPKGDRLDKDYRQRQNHERAILLHEAASSKHAVQSQSLDGRLLPSIELQATNFLFLNFSLPFRSLDSSRGFLSAAAPLYSEAAEGSPVYLATHAAAVAALATFPDRGHLAPLATRLYARALSATQRALQSPDHATSDSTLVTILLFSLYESIFATNHSIQAWRNHVEGAIAIVKARGMEQLCDDRSLVLFRSVRTQMLLTCVQMAKEVEDFPGPVGWLSDLGDQTPESYDMLKTAIEVPNLLHRAKTVLAWSDLSGATEELEEVLGQAVSLQRKLSAQERGMPPQWAFKSTACMTGIVENDKVETTEAWPGPIHSYGDIYMASIRNNNRVTQILCSCVVLDTLKRLGLDTHDEDERFKAARHKVQSLADEICVGPVFPPPVNILTWYLFNFPVKRSLSSLGTGSRNQGETGESA